VVPSFVLKTSRKKHLASPYTQPPPPAPASPPREAGRAEAGLPGGGAPGCGTELPAAGGGRALSVVLSTARRQPSNLSGGGGD